MAINPINGTDAAERLDGTQFRDLILGGGGGDTLVGAWGGDKVYGELGNDLIFGSGGNDWLYGGEGDDELHSDSYDMGFTDHVYGGAGNDQLFAEDKVDYSYGGDGDDTVTIYFDVGGAAYGGVGVDTLVMHYIGSSLNTAGQNYDALVILNGPDAGAVAGPDSMVLGGFEVLNITTYMGDDTVEGGARGDRIDVFTGADVVRAMGGDDVVLYRTGQAATLDGGAGDDTLHILGIEASPALTVLVTGTAATDGLGSVLTGFEHWNVLGSSLDDRAELGERHDRFVGWWGNDTALGMGGNDLLSGGLDNDLLSGGAGRDTVSGGKGLDTLEGGDGADRFVFAPAEGFGDVVNDFASGQDTVAIRARALGGTFAAGVVDAGRFHLDAAMGTDAQFIYDTGAGVLYFDSNGTDTEGLSLIATFVGLPALTADDLLITG